MKTIFIIGGLGHIGLTFAAVMSQYYNVILYDTNQEAREKFYTKKEAMFFEPGLNEILIKSNNITIAHSIHELVGCDYVVITIGTPIDEYLNPVLKPIFALFKQINQYLANQTVILRSTVYPTITKKIEKTLRKDVNIAFCPERVSGGNMIKELQTLPQIISANTPKSLQSAIELFTPLNVKQKLLNNTTSGELAKLFTNSYRYVEFAIANQFLMMSLDAKCDFYGIYDAIVDDYPRMKNFPKPFFSGSYCLRKDSIQLASWYNGATFSLGYDSSLINEALPIFVFRKMREKFSDLSQMTIGLLGMSFKAGTDDTRDSLAFRMKKILENEVKEVLCTDPYVKLPYLIEVTKLIEKSDIVILMTNHNEYRGLKIDKPVIDLLNFFGNGVGL